MNFTLFWRTIAARILAALVGVSFVSIAVSVVSLSYNTRNAMITNIEQRNLEIARQASREISRYITDSIEELGSLGTILGPLPLDPWIRSTMLANLALEFKKFRWMAILGTDGSPLADSGSGAEMKNPLSHQNVANIMANKSIVSQVEVGSDFTPYMIVSTSIRANRGMKGWLVAELHLRSIWDVVDQVSIGGKKVAYLVTGAGRLIAYPDKIRILKPLDYEPLPAPPTNLPADKNWRIEKENGVDKYLTAYAPVEKIDWVVAVQQLLADAFLPASVVLRQSLYLGLIGVVLSLVLGLLLSRALSSPLVHLLEGTRIITAGDLDHRIQTGGGDEVRKLAESFNGMVDSLQARTAQLGESERQYRLMAERVNDVIFMLDHRGIVTFISPRLEAVTGYQPSVATGRHVLDLLPAEEREKYAPTLTDLLEGSGRVDREVQFEVPIPERRKLVIEAHLTGELGPEGTRQVYGVARDVSERARLIEQLNQAQKMEAVGRLAGGVAHDFNNLLTAIIGYCDYSLLGLDDTETVQKNLEEIKKAGGRAAALTQQLLAFSRRQVMKPKVVDLNRLIQNLEKLLRRLLGEDISLDTRLAPDLGTMLADPGQIDQVIMNLCINARDAMPRGGRITLETANVFMESARRESRFAVMRGDYVHLRIVDTGSGMDQETKSHLFEPFFTTKEVGRGTGLGLSTVYGIVKQTSGYIWVESEPGKGTAFDIFFPRAVAAPQVEETAAAPQRIRGGHETVLVVEDEMVIRALVRNVLSSNGYAVLEAEDGERAMDIFKSRRMGIDLVITDLVLPGVGGKDLVENMEFERPGLPALFMSGYTRDIIDNHGVMTSGVAFLQKPFTPEALLLMVREVLDARRTA